jgi:5-methyltetrahydropteroyltriglutamate--homocysteine methyltransferase
MVLATIPGYPRIGGRRELKRALEGYWRGQRSAAELEETAAGIRAGNWRRQVDAGLDLIPVNDFSLYDQMLDMSIVLGAIPERFGWDGGPVDLDLRFAMARGRTDDDSVPALELTKWFDTNYHYLVPELAPDQTFRLADDKPLRELREAQALGFGDRTRVALIGPLTYLLLAKSTTEGASCLPLMDALIPVYQALVAQLAAAGARWISFDEPITVTDLGPAELDALRRAYSAIAATRGDARLLVQTYFGSPGASYETLVNLPVDGVGLDLVRSPETLQLIERHGFPADRLLLAGVVDGRNVWANDLSKSMLTLDRLATVIPGDQLAVSSSCSLLHVPIDAAGEDGIDQEIRDWLAFATQKLDEIAILKRGLDEGRSAIAGDLAGRDRLIAATRSSTHRTRRSVRQRIANLPDAADRRGARYVDRAVAQQTRLRLPSFPTTTIGSFPQTGDIRTHRQEFDRGTLSRDAYEGFLEDQVREVIRHQEEIGLDVLVHGEPERNDMVQYFGEQLDGFAFTHNGWVQSYGSRCVRPPIIFGDVEREAPMTVRWASFAQSLTDRPVKGMLTGPVTILNWSFVRDDQPRSETCLQIALAIQDEVRDLEAAGIAAIQIDEPALREGLPLRRAEWQSYLDWATRCFRITAAIARPDTQIHTHMCYAEFNDIIDAIEALDADVLSIEHARSGEELLEVFRAHGYDKGIGPGVYDVHSPAIPGTRTIEDHLRQIRAVLPAERIWVNPDCGLKTRGDAEVWPSLANMVAAARELRVEAPEPVAFG